MTNKLLDLSRRKFVIGSATGSAGLSLGFGLATRNSHAAHHADGANTEVDAWVLIEPDDTDTNRIDRSEMGQGTLTGLAQMVADELDADWSKVTTEQPTPGQNVARDRVWGSFSTGGSQGIRASQQYVREGGATARALLIEAAANEWGVPASECTASESVITHKPSGRKTTYGKVAAKAAALPPPPHRCALLRAARWPRPAHVLSRHPLAP